MSQLVEELVKSGQPRNLMIAGILRRESTTIAETLMGILKESGATPLTQLENGSTALFQFVVQHTTVRKAIHWVKAIWEG